MEVQVHDHRGIELLSEDLLGFTMTRLERHLHEHGWQLTHRDMETSQWMFADAITQVLTLTITREAGIDADDSQDDHRP